MTGSTLPIVLDALKGLADAEQAYRKALVLHGTDDPRTAAALKRLAAVGTRARILHRAHAGAVTIAEEA